ncbi:MAG: hypothetical protein QNJ64_03375 [Crocosphaera sp.]|nr:hypothetical protein [Crocosphaera sp.]
MINYFCVFFDFCLNSWLFSQPVASHSFHHKYLKSFTSSLLVTQRIENNIDHSYLIPGLWRGFHEFDNLTVYYAYQISSDNRFWARHRVYKNDETIEDITWQGQWEFTDGTLKLKGINLNKQNEQFNIEFKLGNSWKLVYETGSLSQPYQMMILNKIGQP